MTITKKQNGSALEISLSGRLDTITSPVLEKEIAGSLDGVTSLTLDFSELEYISSAGLRVLLTTSRAMAGRDGMKIVNVNETIMEIFDVTGTSEILNIE